MAAIISDQMRILNAENFVSGVQSSSNSYYSFIGLPNAPEYSSTWDRNPPSPKDSYSNFNDNYDTMFALKKINASDISRVVKKQHGFLVSLMICGEMISLEITHLFHLVHLISIQQIIL